MGAPQWYREAVAAHGARVASGSVTPAEAAAALAAEIGRHPEFIAAIAGRDVAKWAERHGQGDLFAEALFPAIPALMTVSPGRKMRTADMTLRDLEMARVMLLVRTRNAEHAALQARKDFARFYGIVKPRLKDGATVGDVMPLLAPQEQGLAS